MDQTWYEVVCESGNPHFTARDSNHDELVKLVQLHFKTTHNRDVSADEARKNIHQIKEPETTSSRMR